MTFVGPMLPIFSARWGTTDAKSGALIFAQFFSSMFGMLMSGVLVQRRGYRLTLILGLILMAAGMALLSTGPFWTGVASVCILGVGYGITTPAGNLRTAEINPKRSASALNVINAVWGAGAMASPFLIAAAQRVHHPGWFLCGTAGALFVLLLALLLSRFVPDTRTEESAPSAHVSPSLRKSRMLPLICVLFFIYVGTETSFGGWVATYARRMQPGQRMFWALMPFFYWGGLLLGRALAAFAVRFRRATSVAKAGLTLALAGGIALVSAQGIFMVVIGSVLAGLGLASIFPISVSLLPGWFGTSARRASGAVFGSGNVGGAVMPWVVGIVSTQYGSLRIGFLVPLIGVLAMLTFYLVNEAVSQKLVAQTHMPDVAKGSV